MKEAYWNVTCSDGYGDEDIIASFTTEQAAKDYKKYLDSKSFCPHYVREEYFGFKLFESVGDVIDSKVC